MSKVNRNVLVIAYYFPPMGLSGVQRTLKFVKYLPQFGWNPIVLTASPGAYYAFDETLIEEIPEIKIYRTNEDITKLVKKKDNSALKYPNTFGQKLRKMITQTFIQPDSRIFWKKSALKLADQIIKENNIDVILATAPPFTDFLIANELSAKYDIPYMLDYRDLWVDNAFYFYATYFHKMYAEKLELKVLTKSSRVVVTTRYMKELLLKRYKLLTHNDINIISHGFDKEDFDVEYKSKINNNKFVITHSGLFPDDLTPKYFLKALSNFFKKNPDAKKDTEVRFIGLMRKNHIRYIRRYKLTENVMMTGYISHKESVSYLLASNILWMMITNNVATPSRLYEYIGAKKPILINAPDGNIKQTALDSNAAIATEVKDLKAIEAAISRFYELWKTNYLPQIDNDYSEKFERKNLTEVLSRELSLCVKI